MPSAVQRSQTPIRRQVNCDRSTRTCGEYRGAFPSVRPSVRPSACPPNNGRGSGRVPALPTPTGILDPRDLHVHDLEPVQYRRSCLLEEEAQHHQHQQQQQQQPCARWQNISPRNRSLPSADIVFTSWMENTAAGGFDQRHDAKLRLVITSAPTTTTTAGHLLAM